MKKISLCADDFGLNAQVDAAIVSLLRQERLTCTSCLVNMPFWFEAKILLAPFAIQGRVGLHLNFTEGLALTSAAQQYFMPVNQLLLKSHLRRFDVDIILAEMRAQILEFQQQMQVLPAFLDGHQHVQQFPGFREALLRVYAEFYPDKKAWVRVSAMSGFFGNLRSFKNFVIYASGAQALRLALRRQGIPCNTSFGGIYDFDSRADYRARFLRFLRQSLDGGLIMCHPGMGDVDDAQDEIVFARVNEFKYFSGSQFLDDLRNAWVELH